MYRNQQPYSNPQGYGRIRQPESTLFEDSPDDHQRAAALSQYTRDTTANPNFYKRTQDPQQHQNQLPLGGSHNQIPRSYAQPQASSQHHHHQYDHMNHGGHLGLNSNNPSGYPTPAPRFVQSEESGGVILTSENVGGGPGVVALNEDDFDELEAREGENDVEYIIMNLYQKMKNLESKYIDLANYYKQELVKTNRPPRAGEIDGGDYNGRNISSPMRSYNRSPEVDQSPGKDSPKRGSQDLLSERQIISDLIQEKKRLEDDMKQMIALKGSQFNNTSTNQPALTLTPQHQQLQQSPQRITDFKTNIPNRDQLRFLNEQLKEALGEVLENLDTTTKKELQYLSTKQNEMYQLAGRYNLAQQLKTESLGLWYDAKTKVSTLMADLKDQISNKKKTIESNLVSSKINTDRENFQHTSSQDTNLKGSSSHLNASMLDEFKRELTQLKKKQDSHQKNVQKLKTSLKFKDNMLKEEQGKLQMIIRELKQGINSEDFNKRLLSGEKGQNNLLMSPFERKIQNYQKSAELRKSNVERSGSRGRPLPAGMSNTGTNFYQYREPLSNPQILSAQSNSEVEQENRLIRQKMRQFEQMFDDYTSKLTLKNQDISDFERNADTSILEINKFISLLENKLHLYSQQLQKHHQDSTNNNNQQRGRSKNAGQRENNHLTVSPVAVASSTNYNSVNKDQEKKLNELLRNNDQIYQELRKANDKYLNQRVENNKLKDEIQIMQNALEDAQVQIRKLNNQTLESQGSTNKQQIRLKSRPNRHDLQNNVLSSTGAQQRNTSNTSSQLMRENEDLKRRVKDLEKECFSLTYYQQELQRRGNANDPYARGLNQENQEMKNKIENLCLQIQKFMLSMRRLQRAVNNKDKDTQNLKAEFERNKKILEQMVKEVKEKEEQKRHQASFNNNSSLGNSIGQNNQTSTHHSMLLSSLDRRDPRFNKEEMSNVSSSVQIRNRSQNPQSTQPNFNQRQPNYPITQRPITTEESNNSKISQNAGLLPPKRGIIRAKQNEQPALSSNSNRYIETSEFNQSSAQDQVQQTLQQNQFIEQEQFNNLLEEIRTMSEDSEKLKKQIEDLKAVNEELNADRNQLEVKLTQKNANLQKSSHQLKQAQDKLYKCEKIVNDYKEGLYSLENHPQLNHYIVSKLKTDLLFKERDLIVADLSQNKQQLIGFGKQSLHTQTEEDFSQQEQISEQVKEEIFSLIQEKDMELEAQLQDLNLRLQDKEADLQNVKRMFVGKLRELESSFVELSQDMIDSEQVQAEASRRYVKKIQQEQTKNQRNNDLERSIEQAVNKYVEDDRDEELEQLAEANQQLHQENYELKSQIKSLQKSEAKALEIERLKILYEESQEELQRLDLEFEEKNAELDRMKKQIEQQKRLSEKTKVDYNVQIKEHEKTISQYEQQMNEIETILQQKSASLKQEQEQRIFFESEFSLKEQQMKKLKDEKIIAEEQKEKLAKRESDLTAQIESLKQEIDYINSLREGENSSLNNSMETNANAVSSDPLQADEAENAKIQTNPTEAAFHYLRLMKATQKEFKILQSQNQKLQQKNDDIKAKLDDLKQEARQTAQELMNMDSQIFELQTQNNKLEQELDKVKGTYKVEEEELRKQIEEQFRERLAFKDTEVEGMTKKLARITQSNIELTTKCARLESNNAELYSENEIYKNRLQSIEMELEMTKINTERDSEQLVEQQKNIEQEKKILEDKVMKKKTKLQELKTLNSELEGKQKQSNWLQESLKKSLEQKLQELAEQLEQEKRLAQELQAERDQQLQQQELERENLLMQQQQSMEELEQIYQEMLEQERSRLEQEKEKLSQDNARELEQYEQEKARQIQEMERQKSILEQQHSQEKERLEQRLKEEREMQESRLKESEKEKIERIRQEMEEEREEILRQNQLAFQQQKQQEMEELQQKLQTELDQELKRKDKERLLVVKLQSHLKSILTQQLQEQIAINQQQVMEFEEIQSEYEQQIEEVQFRHEEATQKHTQDLAVMKQTLTSQHQTELERKDKERSLIIKLQIHFQKLLQKELDQAIAESRAKELEIQEKEEEIQNLREQYEQELTRVEQAKEDEKRTVEERLRTEQAEKEKKTKRERSLVEVLQMKARQAILQQLEEERLRRAQEQEEAKAQIDSLISQKEKELDQLRQTNSLKLQMQEHQLLQEAEAKLKEQQEKLLQENEKLQQEQEKRLKEEQDRMNALLRQEQDKLQENESLLQEESAKAERQQAEIERLKKEQNELMKSMSEHQDQQAQELLEQKEREKEALREELERQVKELEQKINEKEKQGKMMAIMQEKIRQELEQKLAQETQEKEQERALREQELQKLKEDQQSMMDSLKGKTKEEQDRIRKEYEEEQRQSLMLLQEKEQEVKKAKEEQERIQELMNKKKQDEIQKTQEKMREQLEELRYLKDSEIADLQEQLNDKDEIIALSKEKVAQLQQQLKDLKANHAQEQQVLKQQFHSLDEESQIQIKSFEDQIHQLQAQMDSTKSQHSSQIKSKDQEISQLKSQHQQLLQQLEKEKESLLEDTHNEHQSQLEQLRKNLEEEHSKDLKKKDQERSLFEKMQESIREELKKQIDEKEREKKDQSSHIKSLEQELAAKDQDMLRERNEQLEMIRELNEKCEELTEANAKLEKNYQLAVEELENIKKNQLESENQQIKNLSEKLQTTEKQRDDLLAEKKQRDSELSSLKSQLEEKLKEIDAQGQDLEQMYKEMEELQIESENSKQELKQRVKEIQKEKNQNDLQLKLKESMLKKLEEQINLNDQEIQEKQEKLLEQIHQKELESIRNQELDNQLKNLKIQLETAQKENQEFAAQIEDLKKQATQSRVNIDMNQSIDVIESKLGEFNVQLNQLKKEQKDLHEQKKLRDSLVENAEQDRQNEVIGEIGTDYLQYCKRVKYLEKAWILVCKKEQYYFVEQEKIPFERLKKIKVQEIDEKQDQLQKKLQDLQRDKDILVKIVQKNNINSTGEQQSNDDYLQIKSLEIENASIKQELNEVQLHNNNLQQITLQYKAKISELQDMIFKLTETDKSNDTLNLMVAQNQDLKNKYLEQIEINRRIENENEMLKKQISDMDYSFARGGGKSFAQMKPENFDMLNASSIQDGKEDSIILGEIQVPNNQETQALKQKIEKLEAEIEEFKKLRDTLQNENQSLKYENKEIKTSQSNAGEKQQQAEEALENIKHMKSLFIQFLEQIPVTNKKAEDLLPVIYSMMMLNRDEINNLQKVRTVSTEKNVQESVKKGVLGGIFGGQKKK